jgi:hypothetical protein
MAAGSGAEGHRVWVVPDGYLPAKGEGDLVGHEAVCLLNTGPEAADVTLTVYFEDQAPWRDLRTQVGAERCLHLRLDDPAALGGQVIPRLTPYAMKIEATRPIFVQYSRMDVTQPALTLMTTVAIPVPGGSQRE